MGGRPYPPAKGHDPSPKTADCGGGEDTTSDHVARSAFEQTGLAPQPATRSLGNHLFLRPARVRGSNSLHSQARQP
jgi:hypothetical protein